jgi:hypothetical protein
MDPLLSILLSGVALLALAAFLFWLDRATGPVAWPGHRGPGRRLGIPPRPSARHAHLLPPQPRTWRGVRGS